MHLSDLHLGFRRYQRLGATGINQRESDVEATVRRAAAQIVALKPELIVIGGDVFHNVRPTNPAILQAYRMLSEWRLALPGTKIVAVAGNHDAPRTAETGCMLSLFREIGVHVADREAVEFTFPDHSLVVLAVPDVPGIVRPALVPRSGFQHRVLLMHGEVAGMLPEHVADPERRAIEIPVANLEADQWSYIALGHYHVYRQVAPNAWYSGSLDYASSNPWGELKEERERSIPGKGFIEHDLRTGVHNFHPVMPSRRLLDLTPVDGSGMNAADLDRAIRTRIETAPGGIDQAIVRLTVNNVPRHIVRELDHVALREYRRRAMHFQLDTHRPTLSSSFPHPSVRQATLVDIVANTLRQRTLAREMDREALVRLGLEYLSQAEQVDLASLPDMDS